MGCFHMMGFPYRCAHRSLGALVAGELDHRHRLVNATRERFSFAGYKVLTSTLLESTSEGC